MINVALYFTISRILLTPFVVYYFVYQQWVLGLSIFAVALLTDVLDGLLALRFNQCSVIGQILDPVADKILLSSVMFTLLMTMDLSSLMYGCVIFLLFKEFCLLCGGGLLLFTQNFFIPPSILSRFVCLSEVFLVTVVIVQRIFMHDALKLGMQVLLVINVIFSIMLLVRYMIIINKQHRNFK